MDSFKTMRANLLGAFTIIAIIAASHASPASAATVVNNIAVTGDGTGILGSAVSTTTDVWEANAFTTGAGGSWQVNHVNIPLSDFSAEGAGFNPDKVIFEIRADNAGLPGATIVSSLTTAGNITAGTYDFTPTSALVLPSGTTYWLVGRPTDPDADYVWDTITTPGDAGISGWSIADEGWFSQTLGSTWESSSDEDNAHPAQFSIDAVPAPEPTSLGLLAVGAAMMLRRKMR